MERRHGRVVAPAMFAVVAIGCGPSTVQAPAKPPTPPVAKGPEPASPARWVIQSGKVERVGVRLDLGPGAALYVGRGGERWLQRGDELAAATTLLPEPIAAATRAADGKGVFFATTRGAIYEAADPLAPVGARKAPSAPLHAIAVGKSAVLGVDDAGALMRTTDAGATWKAVPIAGARGTLVKLALSEQGLGLALFAPQRLFATDDDGASWQPVASPGIGAADVVRDVNGDVVLVGLESAAVLRAGPVRLERISRSPRVGAYEIANPEARPLALANAVEKGAGALDGDRYYELANDADAKDRWTLAAGPLGGAMDVKRIAALDGCTQVALAARDKSLVALCTAPQAPGGKSSSPVMGAYDTAGPKLRIVRSADGGATWKDDTTLKAPYGDAPRAWIAPDGALLIDGACKPAKSSCSDRALLVYAPGQKPAHVGMPRNWPKVRAVAWSADGKKAFALGTGNGGVALLVSRDAGRDFTSVPLPTVPLDDDKAAPLVSTRLQDGTIAVDDKGVVRAAAHVGDRWALFTTSDDGATVHGKLLPFHANAVELTGRRGLAVANDGGAWETQDGGATWTRTAAPRSAGDALACDAFGCLVGDRATRVGWGVQGAAADASGAGSSATKPANVGTYRCKTEGDWLSIGHTAAAPSAYDAEIAPGTRWMAVREDATKGSVAVVVARPKAKGDGLELTVTPLFTGAGRDDAIAAQPQIEGAAALRFHVRRLPAAKGETVGAIASNQNVDVEVAWWVAQTGQVRRATLRGVGPLDPMDVSFVGKDASMLANVGLLSIAQGGVHARPFATHADAPLYFASDAGKVEKLAYPAVPQKDPGGEPLGLRLDAVRVGGRSVLIGVADPGVQLFATWANESGSAWDAHAWGMWPGGAGDAAFDFTYLGGKPSIVVLHTGATASTSAGWAVPLEPKDDPGEPTPIATQAALGAMPHACAGAQSSPRVVAPYAKGTRHPVIVSGEPSDIVLATGPAIVHGKGDGDACVSAYEAQPVAWSSATRSGAIVSTDDLAHSTLFKIDGDVLSAKAMSCTLESGPLPPALADAEGF